jgi:transglutaminase-like putative cysteine protease
LATLTIALVIVAGSPALAMQRPALPVELPRYQAPVDDRIGDLAASLDYDLERIFRFVADSIRYQPYVGILRGATGTLDAGAGNSVDQALLLSALLDESLIPYRFVQGRLDEAAISLSRR